VEFHTFPVTGISCDPSAAKLPPKSSGGNYFPPNSRHESVTEENSLRLPTEF